MKLRVLLSYFYFPVDLEVFLPKTFSRPFPSLFIDSGAFSAWTQGKPVDVVEYADWLQQNEKHVDVYANLDVKGDVDAGLRNQAYLESRGLKPLPVFHGGEPLSVLSDMVKDYHYIALGGLAGNTHSGSKEMWRFIIKCFQMAKDGGAVYHGFGMTNWKLLKALPWYSVDSTAWGQGYRYGAVPLFDAKTGTFYKARLGNARDWRRHAHLVQTLGFDWREFADRALNDRKKICAISGISYLLAERWLRNRHGRIDCADRPNEPGLRLYLAEASAHNLTPLDAGIKAYAAWQGLEGYE